MSIPDLEPAGPRPAPNAVPWPVPTPQPTIGGVIARAWPLLLALAIAAGVAGAFLGGSRTETFTASTRLNVGTTQLSSRAIPGFAEGTSALAGVYSRIVTSERVLDSASGAAGISSDLARQRISASPIANSSTFAIRAEGPTPAAAQLLANAATTAFVRVARAQNSGAAGAGDALKLAKRAAARVAEAQAEVDRRGAALRTKLTRENRAALTRANGDLATARLRADAASDVYRARLAAQSDPADQHVVEVLDRAHTASSDRSSWIQKGALSGALVGLLLGAGVAVLLARRRLFR